VPWGDLFPQAPQGVQQGNEIGLGDVEDWLALDMRRVFDWLSGKPSRSRTKRQPRQQRRMYVVTVLGFKCKLGYIVPMAFAYTGDNMGSSFCERMKSAAKNVMTEGRALLHAEELEMVVVLRVSPRTCLVTIWKFV
jgi:hypothetical protein